MIHAEEPSFDGTVSSQLSHTELDVRHTFDE